MSSQFRSGSQILESVLGNPHIIFDPYASDLPILLKHSFIDIFTLLWVTQVRLDDEFAEVDLLRRQLRVEYGKRNDMLLVPL